MLYDTYNIIAMSMNVAKYRYARNEEGHIICIDSLTRETRHLHRFYCLGCQQEMVSNIGMKKIHYFSHKASMACNGETYLHCLAKERMKEKFYSSNSFQITYEQHIKCSSNGCKYLSCNCAKTEKQVVDIKEIYDTCDLEKSVCHNGHLYVADLLLTKSNDTTVPPLLIEICVSHKCEVEKVRSGLRIMELRVFSEGSVENHVAREVFTDEMDDVRLYGFPREIKTKLTDNIFRLIHTQGEGFSHKTIPCEMASSALSQKSDLEVNLIEQYSRTFTNPNEYYEIVENYIEQKCFGMECEDFLSEDYIERTLRIQDMFRFDVVKGTPIGDYKVVISASKSFSNVNLALKKCTKILREKIRRLNVIIVSIPTNFGVGGSGHFVAACVSRSLGLPIEPSHIEWEKYGKKAAFIQYNKVLAKADALIFFWNGNEADVRYNIVTEAKKKGLPVRVINYANVDGICPLCGNELRLVNGRFGRFWDCSNYPNCDYRA